MREPRPTLRGIGNAIGGLISGKPGPGAAELLVPEAQLIAVVPDVGDRADTLFATIRLLAVSAALPLIPVLCVVVPINELVKRVLGLLL